ncbi:DUF2834 domain-containing protein [Aurantiacibacter xanthus]|uniref:DUF2834 domain-containing protein n=1 Tax=Aurantiacibacter xanthus TaxID=1784712 RepID=A0A3A1P0I5_9SPHN|nr:DUF2834 domain-containing protein [Aurantiacibacter xanthus]
MLILCSCLAAHRATLRQKIQLSQCADSQDHLSAGASAGLSTDVLISIAVFWVWSRIDAQRHSVRNWWLVLPAGAFVGLSLALPLYLYFRQDIYED